MSLITLASLSMVVVMTSSQSLGSIVHYDTTNARPIFEKYINDYKKKYKDDADKELHYQAFVKKLEKINVMNEQEPKPVFGINKFTDFTEQDSDVMHRIVISKLENLEN